MAHDRSIVPSFECGCRAARRGASSKSAGSSGERQGRCDRRGRGRLPRRPDACRRCGRGLPSHVRLASRVGGSWYAVLRAPTRNSSKLVGERHPRHRYPVAIRLTLQRRAWAYLGRDEFGVRDRREVVLSPSLRLARGPAEQPWRPPLLDRELRACPGCSTRGRWRSSRSRRVVRRSRGSSSQSRAVRGLRARAR